MMNILRHVGVWLIIILGALVVSAPIALLLERAGMGRKHTPAPDQYEVILKKLNNIEQNCVERPYAP